MNIKEQFNLEGKVAIITGSSKGIGKAIAKSFAENGAQVVISSRNQEACDEVVNEFVSEGLKAIGIAMIADGGTEFIEVGPGKVLQGLMRKIDRSVTATGASLPE